MTKYTKWDTSWALAYRGSIFLAAIILASISLSILVNNSSTAVRNMVRPLVEENVPALRGLAEFESALLKYQLALNKYFADSIDHARFATIEKQSRGEMDSRINYLLQNEKNDAKRQGLSQHYSTILALSPRLEAAISARPARWSEAREILLILNKSTIAIRTELDEIKLRVEATVSRAGGRVVEEVDQVAWIIHSFMAATLLVCLFLIYQFWARVQSEQELEFQAWHDPLTRLPNRRAFERHVAQLGTQPCAIALGTIDRFERVTAGLGHIFADKLICELMSRAAGIARETNSHLFRLDSVNFALLCPFASNSNATLDTIGRLHDRVNEPFEFEQREVRVSLSLGMADYPTHGSNAIELLKNADAALQEARQGGDGGLARYSADINIRAQEKIALEAALGHALERNELELYYQPQMSLVDQRLIGFEALVRWKRNGQLVSPADFIPLAEASNLIVPIGDWILGEACRQAKIWNTDGDRKIVVAVNISPRQFRHPEFVSKVSQTLQTSGVSPDCIELEITEGLVMEGQASVLLLHNLRHLGVALAVDDFGTGYSSLSYLKHFPIDKLKIDQSFVRQLETDTNDLAIVKAVIDLGHNLGVKVIAEGVESIQQQQVLATLACDEIQGYGYGRPMPRDQATTFILEAK